MLRLENAAGPFPRAPDRAGTARPHTRGETAARVAVASYYG